MVDSREIDLSRMGILTEYETFSLIVQIVTVLALVATVVITAIYVSKTATIANATAAATRQQERLVSLMEKDLRFRIVPRLRVHRQGGADNIVRITIKNVGTGYAQNLRGRARFGDGEYAPLSIFTEVLAHNDESIVKDISRNDPGICHVELTCTDSAEAADYVFTWNEHESETATTTMRALSAPQIPTA